MADKLVQVKDKTNAQIVMIYQTEGANKGTYKVTVDDKVLLNDFKATDTLHVDGPAGAHATLTIADNADPATKTAGGFPPRVRMDLTANLVGGSFRQTKNSKAMIRMSAHHASVIGLTTIPIPEVDKEGKPVLDKDKEPKLTGKIELSSPDKAYTSPKGATSLQMSHRARPATLIVEDGAPGVQFLNPGDKPAPGKVVEPFLTFAKPGAGDVGEPVKGQKLNIGSEGGYDKFRESILKRSEGIINRTDPAIKTEKDFVEKAKYHGLDRIEPKTVGKVKVINEEPHKEPEKKGDKSKSSVDPMKDALERGVAAADIEEPAALPNRDALAAALATGTSVAVGGVPALPVAARATDKGRG